MTEPRTLKRILLAVLAIVLALQAQNRLFSATPGDGVILYGIAIALFVVAVARVQAAHLAKRRLTDWPAQGESLSYAQVLFAGVAVVAGLAALVLFANPASMPTAWLLHLISVLLFLSVFIFLRPARFALAPLIGQSSNPEPAFPRGNEPGRMLRWIILGAIIALAAFARLWQIDQFPVGTWYDEAFNGNGAVQMLTDPSYRPIFIEGDTLPAHLAYLFALSFKLFGVSTLSMRFVTAAFGIATVVLAYLLFRRWFGEMVGLLAAAFFAVMRFDLTFSRIALHGVTTPFFELLVLYFVDRVLERKRLVDTAWLAVALGVGLAFYTPFRLMPFALGIFGGVLIAIALWKQRDAATKMLAPVVAPHVVVFLLGLLVATVPIAEFALQNPEVFFARTNNVSIFEKRDEPDLGKALWGNFSRHLLMFNWQGDRNGRHNLPNEPELDPVMGALAVLGFCYALWRWRDLPNLLMLILFFSMNLGGILSVDFEAPQSLRSIGVMPALIYFAVLPLAAVAVEVRRVFRPQRDAARASPGGAMIILGMGLTVIAALTTYSNFDTFFNKQKNSPDVWAAHSIGETIVGQEMDRLAATSDLIVTSLFANSPTIRFLAPGVTTYQQWTVSDRLPLARDPGRDVAMLLDPLLSATVDAARRYYPTATYREFVPPGGGTPAVYELLLGNADLQSVQGLVARYYQGSATDAPPVREEVTLQPAANWITAQPLTGTFTAVYRGALYVSNYGQYALQVSGAPTATIFIDETPITTAPVPLARGLHALRVQVPGGAFKFALQWQPPGTTQMQPVPGSVLFRAPVTNNGLMGEYFPSPDWSGKPAFTQVDPEIALYFHNIPLPRPYTVQWTGKVYAKSAGVYRFATESIDESQLMINGQIILNNRGSTTAEGNANLAQGWNDIVVRFADHTSHTHIYLYWTPPNGQREIVPSRYLSPPMGRYPTDAEVAAQPSPLPAPGQTNNAPGSAPGALPTPSPAALLNMSFVQTIGELGNGPTQFNQPHAVAIGKEGRVYVVDTGNRRVQALDANGGFLFSIAGGAEKFADPFDIVTTSTGGLVVLDSELGWLYLFDADGKNIGRIGGPDAQFYHPRGLSIDGQDNLYVADTGGSRVVKMSLQGTKLQVIGTRGTGRGQFVEPTDAAADSSGYIFATDVPNKRVLSFTADGRFVLDFPIPIAGSVNGPHIAIAPDQTLLITAPELHKVQRFSRIGNLLGEWGDPGSADGQFRLPTGIALDGSNVWIVDTGNNRIQLWAIQ